ncbi:hypothetical protein F5146DRAFT_1059089 [Armillaria mellea]|nr:hypothetical protein F5146DRAFT_1059089 [Armillaria mellea]
MLVKLGSTTATPDSTLYKACEYFVAERYDFGTACAHLRPHLNESDVAKHVTRVRQSDAKRRQEMLQKRNIDPKALSRPGVDKLPKRVFDRHAPPRRVWDLHANRVVPYWVASRHTWALSHAWVDDEHLQRVMTPINGYEWPVPMPKDADLNLIRIEMLNLGAEYIWLDVLCLRQEGRGINPRDRTSQEEWDYREALRNVEWNVDVPTIGCVYAEADEIVCYLSGLGLPLSFRAASDFDDDRCWFNRAWTLQETPRSPIIAGITCDDPMADERFMTEDMHRRLHKKLTSLRSVQGQQERTSIFDVLFQMRKRKSTKAVDKIAGLVYLLEASYIPTYHPDLCEEDAWATLVSVVHERFRATLFFLYRTPGNGSQVWRPSWDQVMEEILPAEGQPTFRHISSSNFKSSTYMAVYDGPRIDICTVRGLADESGRGEFDVKLDCGATYTFQIVADPGRPVDDGQYTLVGYVPPPNTAERILWVVGTIELGGYFKKMSVFCMANHRESMRIRSLHVCRNAKTWLL